MVMSDILNRSEFKAAGPSFKNPWASHAANEPVLNDDLYTALRFE